MLLHYLGILKENVNNCILSAQILIPLRVCDCIRWVYLMYFIKILSLSLNTMLIVDKHCCDVCCDEFLVPQIDRKSKQVKEQWHEKFYLESVLGKLAILITENIKIWRWITKLLVIKMQFVSIVFHICCIICRKFKLLISQGIVATYLRWLGNVVWVLWLISRAFQQCNFF